MYKLLIVIISIFLILCTSCQQNVQKPENCVHQSYFIPRDSGIQSGGVKMIPIQTPKGTFKVWTKTIGNHPKMRLLLLNGGPGATHEYFECFESFLPAEGIEIIYYDQLDCGHSDRPKDSSLYDLDRYVEEVEQVRISLGLDQDNFILLGHSWGGILAMQYALKYQNHLKALIISNMMADCKAYDKYAFEVLAPQLDSVVLDSIRNIEARGDFSNPRYMELLMPHFYHKHILRMDEWPEPVNRSFAQMNSELYVIMQGPSEFGISGKLENWDVSKELKNIQVPTLVIGAQYDTMDPKYMEWMSKQFPHGQFLFCPNGSHMCFYDDQAIYFNGLLTFLKSLK